jgi:hypothetical protein
MLPMSEVTRVLSAIEGGDPHAAEQLLPLVYQELRKLAAQKLAHGRRSTRPTGRAHFDRHWDNRRHFIGAAVKAMRCVLK